ncbi:hypothetical protein MHYP_G00358270 [Metynnis hypsauchen]
MATVRCAWAGDDSSDDDHQGTPANNSDKVQRIPASRKKAGCSDAVQRIPASRKKGGRCAWAEGGNTDAQAGDAMTEVEQLCPTINTAKVCAVALRPSSASPSRLAATRMNAWNGAISNWTDEGAEEAAAHAASSLENPPSSSAAWACHQLLRGPIMSSEGCGFWCGWSCYCISSCFSNSRSRCPSREDESDEEQGV